ncbi:DUF1232 domain-containing protein [Paraburkholderia caribensis]|uniref:DUF1232 domain-containing protein n=1 Tax=Paraburkholderia caribensis TaxID=75105 RepID=UPI0006D46A0B
MLLCIVVVAYALSPINLVPDFIPLLGYIVDALLIPGLIWFAIMLLPNKVVDNSRARADSRMAKPGARPTSYVGAALIVFVWLAVAFGTWDTSNADAAPLLWNDFQ